MTSIIIAICLTTGVCAFLFFVLPFMDSRQQND